MEDLVSVIIPCYNIAKWLDDLFKSLDAQDYSNFEVLFVNDGSKDDTAKLLEEYCKTHENCKYIDQENQGVSVARNNGLKLAKGKFVCFVDPDDMISSNFVSRLHELITSGDYDCAVCWYVATKENQNYETVSKEDHKVEQQIVKYTNSSNMMIDFIKCVFDFGSCNKMYKLSSLKNLSGFPNIFNKDIYVSEDFDFCYRFFSKTKNIITTNEKLYYYRQRKSSALHQKFNPKSLTAFAACDNNYQHCKENYPEALKYLVSFRVCQTIGKLMQMKKSGNDSYEEIIPLIDYLDKNYKQCLNKGLKISYPLMRAVFFSRTIRKHNKNKK